MPIIFWEYGEEENLNHSNILKFKDIGNSPLLQKIKQYLNWLSYRFNLTDKEGVADRKVPVQPLVFYSKEAKVSRYNLRKVSK